MAAAYLWGAAVDALKSTGNDLQVAGAEGLFLRHGESGTCPWSEQAEDGMKELLEELLRELVAGRDGWNRWTGKAERDGAVTEAAAGRP